jgi:hypothetical protein
LGERRRSLRRGVLLATVVRWAWLAERTMALTEAQTSGVQVPGSVGICKAAKLAALRLEISAGTFAVAEPTGAPELTFDLEWGICVR